ncbi:MAG: PilZ domain-containing protein [Gammaproteobacteria bacterium]|nr:MAG: PilZ domain-containing protein [Gammaproteobacteria bacterium]
MRDYNEKRDFIRMKVDSEVRISDPESGNSWTGICRDLSGAGMSVEVDSPFTTGSQLAALLPSNNEAFPPLESIVEVVRCTELDNGRFELGLKIRQVNR